MTTTSPARRIEHLPLDEIPHAERNPKAHEKAKIRASIQQFGCTVAGILDERTGRLVAGHGRLNVLAEMRDSGAPAPDGILVTEGDWRAPVVRGWSSANDAEASAYVVADNRLNELGGWNQQVLAEVLDDIAEYNVGLLEVAGYNSFQLDDLIASMGDVVVMDPAPTGARYSESDEEIETRRTTVDGYADRKVGGTFTEMILVFTSDAHAEAVGLIRAIRARDGEQTAAQVVLGALRAVAPDPEEE